MTEAAQEPRYPTRHVAAGALCFDDAGNVLIVKPTYRDHWLIPGGVLEAGELPRETCAREVREELGIDVPIGPLLVIDATTVRTTSRESLQLIFAGGVLDRPTIARIALPPTELSAFRFVSIAEAGHVLNPALARRLPHALRALASGAAAYLEDGEPPVA